MSGKASYFSKRARELSSSSEDSLSKRYDREFSPCLFCGNSPGGCWCDRDFLKLANQPLNPNNSTTWQEQWEMLPLNQMQEVEPLLDSLHSPSLQTLDQTISQSLKKELTKESCGSQSPPCRPITPVSLRGLDSRASMQLTDSLESSLKQQPSITVSSKLSGASSSMLLTPEPSLLNQDQEVHGSLDFSPGQENSLPAGDQQFLETTTTCPSYQTANTTGFMFRCPTMDKTLLPMGSSINDKPTSPLHLNIDKTLNQLVLPYQREISTSPPFRSTLTTDETILFGEESQHQLLHGTTMDLEELLTSISPSCRNSPSSSLVDVGCPPQQRSTYWCLTSWQSMITHEEILPELAKMGPTVLSILGSAPHQSGQTKPTPALVGSDEQTDSEITIPNKNKTRLLRGSDNPLWRGHTKDSPSQIRKLHQGQRIPPDRERSPITTTLEEQTDQK